MESIEKYLIMNLNWLINSWWAAVLQWSSHILPVWSWLFRWCVRWLAVFENLICMWDIPTNEGESPFSEWSRCCSHTESLVWHKSRLIARFLKAQTFIKKNLKLKVCWWCLQSEQGIVTLSLQYSSLSCEFETWSLQCTYSTLRMDFTSM